MHDYKKELTQVHQKLSKRRQKPGKFDDKLNILEQVFNVVTYK